MSRTKDDYDDKEAQARFVAALKGARLAGHVPMKAKKAAKKTAKKRPSRKRTAPPR